jgi:hypothetical protein
MPSQNVGLRALPLISRAPLALLALLVSAHLAHAQTTLQTFEAGQGDWYADNGEWEVGSPTTVGPASCHQGTRCAGTVLNGNYPFTASRLVSPAFRLGTGTIQNPVLLRFWHWFAWGGATGGFPGRGVVQASVYFLRMPMAVFTLTFTTYSTVEQ